MFRGFIVCGVVYAVGWTQGYIAGQNHTEALADLIRDLRNSEETKQFFAEVRITAEELAKRKAEEEETDTDAVVVDAQAEPLPPEELNTVHND
jgi:hypothetical protein